MQLNSYTDPRNSGSILCYGS